MADYRRKTQIVAFLILALVLQGCAASTPAPPVSNLQKVAQASNDIATITQALATSVQTAQTSGAISNATAVGIADVLQQVIVANQQVRGAIRTINQLDPASQGKIANLLGPVRQAVSNAVANGVGDIKDPLKTQILGYLSALGAAIDTIQVITALKGAHNFGQGTVDSSVSSGPRAFGSFDLSAFLSSGWDRHFGAGLGFGRHEGFECVEHS